MCNCFCIMYYVWLIYHSPHTYLPAANDKLRGLMATALNGSLRFLKVNIENGKILLWKGLLQVNDDWIAIVYSLSTSYMILSHTFRAASLRRIFRTKFIMGEWPRCNDTFCTWRQEALLYLLPTWWKKRSPELPLGLYVVHSGLGTSKCCSPYGWDKSPWFGGRVLSLLTPPAVIGQNVLESW